MQCPEDLALIRLLYGNDITQGKTPTVLVDKNARIVATGHPDKEQVFIVERRADKSLLHVLPQSINEEGLRAVIQVVSEMNMGPHFSDECTLQSAISIMTGGSQPTVLGF